MSLVLAADARSYVAGLTAFREADAAGWCRVFAEAIERAAREASELATRLAELQEKWRERAGPAPEPLQRRGPDRRATRPTPS